MGNVVRVGAALVVLSVAICAQTREPTSSYGGPGDSPRKTTIAYADVQPLWDTLRQHLPSQLIGKPVVELESTWRDWVRTHDVGIRARVARGDEDSLVNLWLFGTSFTDLPPARPRDVTMFGDGATLAHVADRRLSDLLEALKSAGANERLRWAGQILRGKRD